VQCEETATRTWDLSVTGGEALPLHQARPSTMLFTIRTENTPYYKLTMEYYELQNLKSTS
jgi:hypothetical protein